MEAAVDLARAKDLVEVDPAEAAQVGATARADQAADLVVVLVTVAAAALVSRERTRERAAKFPRLGLELGAWPHLELTLVADPAHREAELSKAGPSKWALARVEWVAALVQAEPELKAERGILW